MILEKEIMSTEYPTDNELDILLQKNEYFETIESKMSRKELKTTVLYLRIYFDKLELEEINEIPKINILDLISSHGGTLDLFLGMSFISFFEIFDLIYHLSVRFFKYIF